MPVSCIYDQPIESDRRKSPHTTCIESSLIESFSSSQPLELKFGTASNSSSKSGTLYFHLTFQSRNKNRLSGGTFSFSRFAAGWEELSNVKIS